MRTKKSYFAQLFGSVIGYISVCLLILYFARTPSFVVLTGILLLMPLLFCFTVIGLSAVANIDNIEELSKKSVNNINEKYNPINDPI